MKLLYGMLFLAWGKTWLFIFFNILYFRIIEDPRLFEVVCVPRFWSVSLAGCTFGVQNGKLPLLQLVFLWVHLHSIPYIWRRKLMWEDLYFIFITYQYNKQDIHKHDSHTLVWKATITCILNYSYGNTYLTHVCENYLSCCCKTIILRVPHRCKNEYILTPAASRYRHITYLTAAR